MNKTVYSNSKEILPIAKATESCDLDCEGKILTVSATCTVQNTECINKELRISYVTTFRAISQEDGEYDMKNCRKEGTISIVNENINPSSKCMICARVTNCTFIEKDGGHANAEIEVFGWVLKENELCFLDSAVENVHCRTAKYEVQNVVCLEKNNLTVSNSNEARLPLKKIMDYSSTVHLNNIYPSQGSFQVDGEIISRLVGLSDSGIFVTQNFATPFTTEITSDCVGSDSNIDIYAEVIKTDITITDGDKRVFVTETDICFTYAVEEKCEIDGIVDCYSKTQELTVEEKENTLNTFSCFRTVRDKTSNNLKVDNVIEEILYSCTPHLSNVKITIEDALKIEGIINTTLVYTDENGICTKQSQIPFSTIVATDFDCRETFIPEIKITSLNARLRSATEIETTAEITISVRGTNRHSIKLISSIEPYCEKPEADYAISLYIVKPGETLWDVAKALNTDEETITKLNPDLTLPLKGGEKVLIYNELIFEI